MGNAVFDAVAEALERETDFDRLAARGTLRLALRAAGLDANAGAAELADVVALALPTELTSRGIDRPDELCRKLRRVALEGTDRGDRGTGAAPAPSDQSRREQK